MSTHVQKIKQVDSNGRMVTRTTRVEDEDLDEARADVESVNIVERAIWYIAGVLITLLSLRFILALLGANPNNQFANFIYNASHPFVAPFFSLFGYDLQYGVSHFETYTLVAMLVYALIAWGIVRLVTLTRDTETSR